MEEENKNQQATHNVKRLGFSGLRGFGSRFNFFQRWIGTHSENPTVSYCQTLSAMTNLMGILKIKFYL
jgi:hypothetical protein